MGKLQSQERHLGISLTSVLVVYILDVMFVYI